MPPMMVMDYPLYLLSFTSIRSSLGIQKLFIFSQRCVEVSSM